MLSSTWFLILLVVIAAILVLYIAYVIGMTVVKFLLKRVILPLLIAALILAVIFFVGVAVLDTYFGTDIWTSLSWF